jgi:hypothetical protein
MESNSVFFNCEECEQKKAAREAREIMERLKEKRKSEYSEALKRKRDRDVVALQQQMRVNKTSQEKLTHYIGVKDTLLNDLLDFSKPDKLKLLPLHVQAKSRDAVRQIQEESANLVQSKQRLSAEITNIENKIQFVNSQHEKDATDSAAFQLYSNRKDMLAMDEECRQYEWNSRGQRSGSVTSVSSSGSVAESTTLPFPIKAEMPSKMVMAGYMKTWGRELEKARAQLKRNTANQAIYSKQITMKIDQCRDLETRLQSLEPGNRAEAEEALRNAQDQTHWLSRSLDDIKRGQPGLEAKLAEAQEKYDQQARKVSTI